MKFQAKLHAQWDKYAKEYSYSLFQNDMTEYGYVLLQEVEIDFEVPSAEELTVRQVEALKKKLEATRTAHYAEQRAIVDEIEELLCLPAPASRVKEELEVPVHPDDDIPF